MRYFFCKHAYMQCGQPCRKIILSPESGEGKEMITFGMINAEQSRQESGSLKTGSLHA